MGDFSAYLKITPRAQLLKRSVKKVTVQLPKIHLIAYKAQYPSPVRRLKQTSFTPINLTPPKLHSLPSARTFYKREKSTQRYNSVKKSYFELGFPEYL